jgi:cell shape-determining protein MreD
VTRWIALFVLGSLAIVVQGALATLISPPWCPDLALLVVLAIGLRWEGVASGLLLVSVLGFGADLASGGLRGGHALLRMFVFISARLATRQLNLGGSLPLASFAAGLTIVYGLAVVSLTRFFTGADLPSWGWLDLLPHAIVNSVAAPLVSGVVGRLLSAFGDDDEARQRLDLGPGKPVS